MFNPGYEASDRYESLSELVARASGNMSHVMRSGSRTRNSNYDYHQRQEMLTLALKACACHL